MKKSLRKTRCSTRRSSKIKSKRKRLKRLS